MIDKFKNFVITKAISFKKDRRGVAAVEYALLAALTTVGIIVGLRELGVEMGNIYETITTELRNAQPGP